MALYTEVRAMFNQILNICGCSVDLYPVTKSISNDYGDETLTEGTKQTIKVYIVKQNHRWTFDEEGQIEGGDALLLVPSTITIKKDDRIAFDSENYIVENTQERFVEGKLIYTKCNLFLKS